jgi:hypothetical protein
METINKDYLPDFLGKCVSISLRDDDVSHDLCDPRFEYQGNRLFIIGYVPKGATESDWAATKTSAIAWDRVQQYFVFDNLKDYQKAIKKSEDFQKTKKSKKKE